MRSCFSSSTKQHSAGTFEEALSMSVLVMTVTTVITLKINVPFREWVKSFDSDLGAQRHAEFGIKPLYRGVSKANRSKIVVIHQAPEGAADAFIQKYGEWISSHGVDLSTAEVGEWLEE